MSLLDGGKYALSGIALVKGAVSKHYDIPLGGSTVAINVTDKTRGQIKVDVTGISVSAEGDLDALQSVAQEAIKTGIICQTFEVSLVDNPYGDIIFPKKKVFCSHYDLFFS